MGGSCLARRWRTLQTCPACARCVERSAAEQTAALSLILSLRNESSPAMRSQPSLVQYSQPARALAAIHRGHNLNGIQRTQSTPSLTGSGCTSNLSCRPRRRRLQTEMMSAWEFGKADPRPLPGENGCRDTAVHLGVWAAGGCARPPKHIVQWTVPGPGSYHNPALLRSNWAPRRGEFPSLASTGQGREMRSPCTALQSRSERFLDEVQVQLM